ncbi:MAG: ADP-heptose:LPS heptosyltransferase [Patiriisocius sp.]|jgi:ADP-heptose:LPS heptosyltransferase
MTKILIIRLSSIGDIVLTTPVLRSLKRRKSYDYEVHYVVKEVYESVLSANPYIDKLWTYKDNVRECLPSLVKEKFDYVIDLHNNLRSLKIKQRIKAPNATVDKLNLQKWVLVNTGVNLMAERHIVDRYMDCLDHFNIENDHKGLDHYIDIKDHVDLSKISMDLKENDFIAWCIGATYKGKRFSKEKNVSVLKQIREKVVLIGGPTDMADADYIKANLGSNVYNTVGRYSLNQSANIVKQARLVVTPDTGMMHIAAAYKKDIIALWGCTTPNLGMGPYEAGLKSVNLEPENLRKRPCSKLGNRCKYKGGCINRILDEDVLHHINWIYNS